MSENIHMKSWVEQKSLWSATTCILTYFNNANIIDNLKN